MDSPWSVATFSMKTFPKPEEVLITWTLFGTWSEMATNFDVSFSC